MYGQLIQSQKKLVYLLIQLNGNCSPCYFLHTPNKQQAISKPCLSLRTHKIHFESFTQTHTFLRSHTHKYRHAHILYSRHARYSFRHSNFSCRIKMGNRSIKINEIEFVENLHTLELTHAMSLFASHKTSVHTLTHTHKHTPLRTHSTYRLSGKSHHNLIMAPFILCVENRLGTRN